MVLPRLTVLDERYAIGGVLDAAEPLVVAYQAWNLHTEEQVILEEFFPAPLVRRVAESPEVAVVEEAHEELFRYGCDQFLKEAAVLASVGHTNLVQTLERFEAHNTAYRVLPHHKGAVLSAVLAKQGGTLALKTALTILFPLLDGLHAAHQRGLIHGAFSPQAVFLTKDHGPMLRGFRTMHIMLAQRTGAHKSLLAGPVSAPEQYTVHGRQGPWTDVYGGAATLFQMLTGQAVPDVPARLEDDAVPGLLDEATDLPDAVRELLGKALALDSAQRFRSVQSFHQQLVAAVQKKPAPQPEGAQPEAAQPEAAQPETAQPEAAQPEATQPEARPAQPAPEAQEQPAPKPSPQAKPVAEAPAAPVPVADEPQAPATAETPEPVTSLEQHEDLSAQEVAAQAAKKQAVQKHVLEHLAAKKEAAQKATSPDDEPEEKHASKLRIPIPKALLRLDREAVGGRRGLPVLAALAVVVLVALSGAYVLMQGSNSELAQFGHYKAQGDSLFAEANYMEAKTQYEHALAAAPNNEYIEGRLTETQQRLAEVQDTRYAEYMAEGDRLYAIADSLLRADEAVGALSSFAEANKAYYEALRYRPNDPLLLEKGRLTTAGMEEALRRNRDETGQASEAAEASDPAALRQQLYNSYRQQGDALLARGDLAGAREKYSRALQEMPGNDYALAKIREIDAGQAASGRDTAFEELLDKAKNLSAEGRYAEAKIVFRQALDVKPDEQRALDGLDRATVMLENTQRDGEYQQLRNAGDSLAGEDKLDEALASYKQALTIKPGDTYVRNKVRELQRTLEERRLAQEAADEAAREAEQEPDPAPAEPQPPAPASNGGIYAVVDEAPELIGGLQELHSRMQYPERAKQLGLEGRVYVQFVVTENGQVQDAAVIRGIGGGCDEEALRVVQGARFVPGKVGGRPVKVRHTLFVTFRL